MTANSDLRSAVANLTVKRGRRFREQDIAENKESGLVQIVFRDTGTSTAWNALLVFTL
jgi:hypothetical protein